MLENDTDPFDFSSLEGEGTPEPAADEAVTISREELATMQGQLKATERWKQDVTRVMTGQNGNPEASNEDLLATFVKNPASVLGVVLEKSTEAATQRMQSEALRAEYRVKNPDLVDHEEYITLESNKAFQEAQAKGKTLSEREYIEEGIKRFRAKFQKSASDINNKTAAQDLTKQMLKMELGSPSPEGGKLTANDIKTMSNEKFAELERRVREQNYI